MADETEEESMTTVPEGGDAQGDGAGGVADGAREGMDRAEELLPDWLSRHRVSIPEPPVRHLLRPNLLKRCMPTNQRVTVLLAGGGFGKTTLLAECCRELRASGVPTAWLSLDERDDPVLLDNYLALAFQHAGIDVLEPLRSGNTDLDIPSHRTALLARAIEAHPGPCVLAVDELERLKDPRSIALLNSLLESDADRLHVALGCRELPVGIDVGTRVLTGQAALLTTEDLRFSRAEIAQFFEERLSGRELARVAKESEGWPIALRIRDNEGHRAADAARVRRNVVGNWVGSRLLYDLSDEDREFVLDAGLFDWIDGDLLDDVLQQPDSIRRLEGVGGLEGLLEPVRGRSGLRRLHPLVREHCVTHRFRETPDRYRSVHRRTATALARRGDTVGAMRHASEAGEPALVGQILLDAGAVRLWIREGGDRLVVADRYLSEETLGAHPQLALVRCVARVSTGRLQEARHEFDNAMARWAGRDTAEDARLAVDRYIVRGLMAHTGCEWIDSEEGRAVVAETARIADLADVDPAVRGMAEYGLCFIHSHRADFDAAMRWGERAKERVRTRAPYVRMLLEFQFGQVAMAQGRVQDAINCYRLARGLATERFLREPRVRVYGEVLAGELDMERNRFGEYGEPHRVSMELYRRCSSFSVYAAASEIGAELTLEVDGVDAALGAVHAMNEFAREDDLPMLRRYLAGLRVSLLADAGRVREAERVWRDAGLPDDSGACLELGSQSWREAEALACARLRLLVAGGAFAAGRQFADKLTGFAAERGLRRTLMRALALSIALEQRSGHRAAALERFKVYLGLFAETDYARPLVRYRELVGVLSEAVLENREEAALRATVLALLRATEKRAGAGVPRLSPREREVLERLDARDADVGAALGLTTDGVRYHVKKIFRKLDVHDRHEAQRRARELGILPKAK